MALVLTLREGEDFYIRDERIVLVEIHSDTEFTLKRELDGALFRIKEGRAVEIFKGVKISVGARGQLGLTRVAIEAPRSLTILRGDNYRRGPAKP